MFIALSLHKPKPAKTLIQKHMKKSLVLLSGIILFMFTAAHAQSKKDLENDYAKCMASKDSVINVLADLTASHESLIKTSDSLKTVCTVYDTMYSVIREKVFQYDFDPALMASLIDSLSTSRESAFSSLSTSLNDSIETLNTENAGLKATIESLSANQDESDKVVDDLKKLKELLDAGIITQEEFDAKKIVLLEKL
jgi:hypothetical protein